MNNLGNYFLYIIYKMAYKKKSSVFRRFRKGVRRAGQMAGKVLKKRYYPNQKLNIGQIAKDVAMVKRMVNAEKKATSININNQVFGQVLGNSQGFHSNDITPIPSQGVGDAQRTGNSIKICSWHMTAQIIQQSAATQAVNYKMYMFKIKGDPQTSPGNFAAEHWNSNNFVGGGGSIIDYNSQINSVRFADSELIYFKRFRIAPDSMSGQTGFRTINIGGKLQSHVRYNGSTTDVTNGQIILVILADSGNCSPTTASTLSNIPVTAVNTGCVINYHLRWYYYDN